MLLSRNSRPDGNTGHDGGKGRIMQTSKAGLEFIASHEGCVLNVYEDVAGYPTIGIGHLIRDGEDFSGGITRDQAIELLQDDAKEAEDCVNANVTVDLSQEQFDALVSFVFNVGIGAFRKSTLLRLLNEGRPEEVPVQLKRWNKAGGKIVQGLISRRAAESDLWETATYA